MLLSVQHSETQWNKTANNSFPQRNSVYNKAQHSATKQRKNISTVLLSVQHSETRWNKIENNSLSQCNSVYNTVEHGETKQRTIYLHSVTQCTTQWNTVIQNSEQFISTVLLSVQHSVTQWNKTIQCQRKTQNWERKTICANLCNLWTKTVSGKQWAVSRKLRVAGF